MNQALVANEEYSKETIEETRLEAVETLPNTKSKLGDGETAKWSESSYEMET